MDKTTKTDLVLLANELKERAAISAPNIKNITVKNFDDDVGLTFYTVFADDRAEKKIEMARLMMRIPPRFMAGGNWIDSVLLKAKKNFDSALRENFQGFSRYATDAEIKELIEARHESFDLLYAKP